MELAVETVFHASAAFGRAFRLNQAERVGRLAEAKAAPARNPIA